MCAVMDSTGPPLWGEEMKKFGSTICRYSPNARAQKASFHARSGQECNFGKTSCVIWPSTNTITLSL